MKVIWTNEARDAISEIADYIRKDSPQNAEKVADGIFALTRELGTAWPERGRLVPESRRPGVREVFYFKFRIFYEVVGDEVRILNVVRGTRKHFPRP